MFIGFKDRLELRDDRWSLDMSNQLEVQIIIYYLFMFFPLGYCFIQLLSLTRSLSLMWYLSSHVKI